MKQHLIFNKAIIAGVLAITVSAAAVSGCANQRTPIQSPSGFLPDYSLLQQVPSPEGTQIYTYSSPDFTRSNYHALIVDSVQIYQTASSEGVANTQIGKAKTSIDNGLKQLASKKIPLTSKPGPGVARLSVAITGAQLEGDGFKVRNLIPVSAAIKLATMATNTDNKKPVLIVELKYVDSISGALLRESVTVISGESFRLSSNTSQEFQQLAQAWVKTAYQYANTHIESNS